MTRRLTLALVILLLLAGVSHSARAIVVLGGNGRLALPPTGDYAGSGVQYVGTWGAFTGTAIGPHHFLTAAHVGGGIGEPFTLNGTRYIAEARYVIPQTDLAIWQVAGTLPCWAALYTGSEEIGREIVLFGRGGKRGRTFRIDGQERGWLWGDTDGMISWGSNRVEAVTRISHNSDVLVFGFDESGGATEGSVSHGDSGGGVFIHDGTAWKLAGVNFATNGRYSRFPDGRQPFLATLYDARGLYEELGGKWVSINPSGWGAMPTIAFATRVSPHLTEIRRILSGRDEGIAQRPLSRRQWAALGAGVLLLGGMIGFALWKRKKARRYYRDSW